MSDLTRVNVGAPLSEFPGGTWNQLVDHLEENRDNPIFERARRSSGDSDAPAEATGGSSLLRAFFLPITQADITAWVSTYSIVASEYTAGSGSPGATWDAAKGELIPSLAKAKLLSDIPGGTGEAARGETMRSATAKAIVDFIGTSGSGNTTIPGSDFTLNNGSEPLAGLYPSEGEPDPPSPTGYTITHDESTYTTGDTALLTYTYASDSWAFTSLNPSSAPTDDSRIDVMYWEPTPMSLGTEERPFYRIGAIQLESGVYHSFGACGVYLAPEPS